ncbi:hypothetical protein D187_002855 [Cystobacter fuscus DSM 2262]|uniref:Uncharacterized protein n=1 Tax=Cystobacter fuscus (strain ATCC 25194 / DSM 2262 / NBRC 100088 / M29) TaxID=1242864 RepID=S9P4F5_CYSF2|nr:putative metal-binding motif-containing protein [Cystobacter fuscus]EPX59365.1 hypothetical protein D187_002855 [Cystobacter fuscus DSM 2262]
MLGLLWMCVACSEKGPPEGAVRLTVNYGSYRPACLRVVARDAQGHEVGTNLLQSEFKEPEARRVQVAVLRQPEWSRELTLEVSSFAGSTGEACSGTLVETHSTPSPILVPQRDFASFEVTLRAKDDDGDTFIAREEGVAGTDCDDGRGEVYPGAAERCSVAVDYDCDGFKGCQDSKCQQRECDDGNACTTGDMCNGSGVCQGTQTSCTPSSICFRAIGCAAQGTCIEEPEPSKVNATCALADGTANGVCRATDGKCSRFPYVPSNFDPDVIPTAGIIPLNITCDVTFDSTTLSWTPATCVSNPPTPIELTQGNGMVLFALSNLNLVGNLRLVGNRPVILAVYGDATLNYGIFANGQGTVPGTGGSLESVCTDRRGRGGASSNSVGGGGGGAGGGSGGAAGGNGTVSGSTRGDGGSVGGNVFVPLVGGCPGGGGGGDSVGGAGGAGGGAVQISVAGTLTVTKQLSASGGGGRGGQTTAEGAVGGGGGGGSGGQVLLEAHQLNLNASSQLTANGGGGGEGGLFRASSLRPGGNAGEDGSTSSASQANGGSNSSTPGGDGGKGGTQGLPGTGGNGVLGAADDKAGGGGGGGAAGHIRLRSVKRCTINASTVISPPTNSQCPL